MTSTGSVLYVHADGVGTGGPGALDALEADFDVVVAEGAVDALKRLASTGSAITCVVTPASLPDLPLDAFVERIHEATGDPAIVVVGDLPGDPDEVAALVDVEAYIPHSRETALAQRVRRLETDAGVDRALAMQRRLSSAVATLAVEAAAAQDQSAVESAVYDQLVSVDTYRHVWVGRLEDGELSVSVPGSGSLDEGSLRDLVGEGDPGFVDRAVETGQVVATGGSVPTRATATATGVGEDGTTSLASAAVPFLHGGEVLGVAIVSTERPGAFDGSERELLADLGAVAGHALWALEAGEDDGESLSTSEEIETLVHELRNPLGIAKSHLDIAREDEDFEPLERAESALDRMADVIDRAGLGIGGEPTVNRSTVSLREIATLAWESVDAPAATLEVEGSRTVRADRALLMRLLTNLFQNAVEHGGDDVTVRVGLLDDGFYAEDDGVGIPAAEREAIFDRGYSTAADGLGIGLSIVSDVVRAHGWELSVTEGSNGGARFEVTGIGQPPDDEDV